MSGKIHPWVFARKGAEFALQHAECSKEGEVHNSMTALIMTHFALDGFLYSCSYDLHKLLNNEEGECNFKYDLKHLSPKLDNFKKTQTSKKLKDWHKEIESAPKRYEKINELLGRNTKAEPYKGYLETIDDLRNIRNGIAHPKPQSNDFTKEKEMPQNDDSAMETTWPHIQNFKPEPARKFYDDICKIINDLNEGAHGCITNLGTMGLWCFVKPLKDNPIPP